MAQVATIQRRFDTSTRLACADCGKPIPSRTSFTRVDGKAYHLFCASDSGKQVACTGCFIIGPCDCDSF